MSYIPSHVTVPDSSPWIKYEGNWGDSDLATELYTNGTFHFTSDGTATATITFNGTGFQLIGAKRRNHGRYQVTLDGTLAGSFSGTTPDDPGDFNFTLYAARGLQMKQHTVILANADPGKFLDLDYAMIELGDGNPK
jgi:hypothetical protein